MEKLRKHVADLEAKAAEAALIADLATDPTARVKYARLAQELAQAIDGLRLDDPDRRFLLLQAEKCRILAAETTGEMHADLHALADHFEMKAKQA
jgi:hypothetical protein